MFQARKAVQLRPVNTMGRPMMFLLPSLVLWSALPCLVLASSRQSPSLEGCTPTQVHLALTGDPTEMRIMWRTRASGCTLVTGYILGRTNVSDLLRIGMNNLGGGLTYHSDTYSSEDMCSSPAADYTYDPPPYLHTTILTGLEPGQVYSYDVGDGEVRSFRAAPRPAVDARVRFAVYGDMGESRHYAAKSPGGGMTAGQVEKEILDGDLDFVLHVGDISYANGDPVIWDTFMDVIQPYASVAPYMIAIGNHEYDWRTGEEKRAKKHKLDPSGSEDPYDPDWGNYGNDSGGECGVAVSKRFIMPGTRPSAWDVLEKDKKAANAPFWYSFDYGPVHFVVISTEHDLTPSSRQHLWMVEDLLHVDRCVTPWLVVSMHRPMYVVFPHKSNRIVGKHLRRQLEDVFEVHGVDMVLSGHVHSYARTCNVVEGVCVPQDQGGMTHIIVGCGGHKLSDIDYDRSDVFNFAEAEFGYGRVSVDGVRSLLFEYVYSETGKVGDLVELTSPNRLCRAVNNGSAAAGVSQPGVDRLQVPPPDLETSKAPSGDIATAARTNAAANVSGIPHPPSLPSVSPLSEALLSARDRDGRGTDIAQS